MKSKEEIKYNPDVTWRVVDGEVVILNLETDFYYSLNEVGTRMWELMNKENTPSQIVEIISTEYKVDKKKIEKDLSGLIKRLKKEGLIIDKK